MEYANRSNKICEFGYVLTDENFNILKKKTTSPCLLVISKTKTINLKTLNLIGKLPH